MKQSGGNASSIRRKFSLMLSSSISLPHKTGNQENYLGSCQQYPDSLAKTRPAKISSQIFLQPLYEFQFPRIDLRF